LLLLSRNSMIAWPELGRRSLMKQIITSPNAPVTGFTDASKPAPIAQAIRAGNMLFVSGQGPLNAQREVVSDDIQAQTRQTLENLRAILEHAGASFTNVVNMRVCLRNVADFPKFNETFGEIMAGEKVTRTCIGGTPHRTGVNVEIDCVAVMD
jgi:2-iminobutanoate/2-iminopropanoate deaminase